MIKKKLLIIDDEIYILKSISRLLEEQFDIQIALGGKSALDLIQNSPTAFDIILSDLSMPQVNGSMVYQQIAKLQPGLENKIIFMTGGAFNADLKKFIDNIKNICIEKPFRYQELMQVLDKFPLQAKE